MQHETTMNSDMASELREQMARPDRELGFYLVASNRELLNHMEGIMNRRGIFGVMDSNGRVHYLVDARKGTPLAARNIMATTQNVISRHLDGARTTKTQVRVAVSRVLSRYEWNVQLRGYRLLGEILRMTAVDVSLLNPISKRLYPEVASRQKLKPHQIERNIRYLFDDLASRESQGLAQSEDRLLLPCEDSLPVGRTIARLTEEVREMLEQFEGSELQLEELENMLQ